MDRLPQIIQGGMGAGVSGWPLARTVSKAGQLGVVAGTALDVILARRLQLGDIGGHMRRALAAFPLPGIADKILDRYFVEGGKAEDAPYRAKPMIGEQISEALEDLIVVSNFAEIYLAMEGHDGMVGVNYLEKIQVPTLPSILGAMLAGVTFVLMGAGIPVAIPGILDRLAEGKPVELALDIRGSLPDERFKTHFDPTRFLPDGPGALERPRFLGIVSTEIVARVLSRKASGKVDGFIIEAPTAGGHNAPPRGRAPLGDSGEPVYGTRDVPNHEAFRDLGAPFWLAGSRAEPERLQDALAEGATGIQVGTAFAFSRESGLMPETRATVLAKSKAGTARVFTDPVCSPTGFPFKVAQLEGTASEQSVYEARPRICDLGYLRHGYRREDGKVGWRCPSEPLPQFERKGGELPATEGRKCVCNGLMANIGMAQFRKGRGLEPALFTAGDDIAKVARFLPEGAETYSATDVIAYLLGPVEGAGDADLVTVDESN